MKLIHIKTILFSSVMFGRAASPLFGVKFTLIELSLSCFGKPGDLKLCELVSGASYMWETAVSRHA